MIERAGEAAGLPFPVHVEYRALYGDVARRCTTRHHSPASQCGSGGQYCRVHLSSSVDIPRLEHKPESYERRRHPGEKCHHDKV